MSKERNLVRVSTEIKDRLKSVSDRDGFTLSQAFDIVVSEALLSLETGESKLSAAIISAGGGSDA